MARVVQVAMNGGELDPDLFGRVDLPRYASSVALARNFCVLPSGALERRPGTRFVAAVGDESQPVRLQGFAFSAGQTAMLEFGHQYIRFHTLGATVMDPLNPTQPYQVPTPYSGADLAELQFAALADTIVITHHSYQPRELARLAVDSWVLTTISNVPTISAPTNVTRAQGTVVDTSALEWAWVVTAINALGEESLGSVPYRTNAVLDALGRVNKWRISWDAVAGAVLYYVYRGRDHNAGAGSAPGVYGFIGQTEVPSFYDDNLIPVYSETPPLGDDPFVGAGNYPRACGYFEQRRFFGGTDLKPQHIFGSESANFTSFRRSQPPRDDQGIVFPIMSLQIDAVLWMLPLGALIVGTRGGVHRVRGDQGIITPSNPDGKLQSGDGASALAPVMVGDTALYLAEEGPRVRDLSYTWESDKFTGSDRTVFARHLFAGYRIVSWAYAREPWSAVWAVRSDGVLLAFTFVPEQEVWAWARFETEDRFEDVATVREGEASATYFVVRRTVDGQERRYIERLAERWNPLLDDAEEAFHVDCGLSYDGRNLGDVLLTPSGVDTLYGSELTLSASAAVFDASFDVGSLIVFPWTDADGLARQTRVLITEVIAPDTARGRLEADLPESFLGIATDLWEWARFRVRGLDHLEGREIVAMGDGNALPWTVVTGGEATFAQATTRIHAGLSYVGRVETLDLLTRGSGFEVKGVSAVDLLLIDSTTVWAGAVDGELYEVPAREDEGWWRSTAARTAKVRIAIESNWNAFGRIAIEARDPIPCRITALAREGGAGD